MERGTRSWALGTVVTNEGPGTRPCSQRLALGTPEGSLLGLLLSLAESRKAFHRRAVPPSPTFRLGPTQPQWHPASLWPRRAGMATPAPHLRAGLPFPQMGGVPRLWHHRLLGNSGARDLRAGVFFSRKHLGCVSPAALGPPLQEDCWTSGGGAAFSGRT